MKTQIELINYYKKQLQKVAESHGFDSDETVYAFFLLQAVKINLPINDVFDWAHKKMELLHKEALEINHNSNK